MSLNSRQKIILDALLNEYVKTAQAVSSGVLVNKYKLDISPATVRNELVVLEEEGYIYQPHISAGRIPSAKAYKLNLEEAILKKTKISKSDLELLSPFKSSKVEDLKVLAKLLAESSGQAVFWAFHKNELYYTGLGQLFSQAEFKQTELIYDVSKIVDRMDEIIADLFDDFTDGIQILIGEENPFGSFLGLSILKYRLNAFSGLLGLISPIRADYLRNYLILDYVDKKILV